MFELDQFAFIASSNDHCGMDAVHNDSHVVRDRFKELSFGG